MTDTISNHVFLFPFTLEGRINRKSLYKNLIKNGWEDYKINHKGNALDYNEYYFFYDYVREMFFNVVKDESSKKQENIILEYKILKNNTEKDTEKDTEDNNIMVITIKDSDNNEKITTYTFTLIIDHISLIMLYERIGILEIRLLNNKYEKLDDILRINDYGRRIYPQFLDENDCVKSTKKVFLADSIDFRGNKDDFNSFKHGDHEFKLAGYIIKLLEIKENKNFFYKLFEIDIEKKLIIHPIIDDRMFTVCWYGNKTFSNRLKKINKKNSTRIREHWYKYIYVDGKTKGCKNPDMIKKLIDEQTNKRWLEDGTLYAFTRYSMMCVTDRSDFAKNVIKNHMVHQYCSIAKILLIQRAFLINFSKEITKISRQLNAFTRNKNRKNFDKITDEAEALHARFLCFTSDIWNIEVTPQEQGIELYDLGMKAMRLKEHFDRVKSEIRELFDFINMRNEKVRVEEERKLNTTVSILSFIFLPLSVISGLWGMNFIKEGTNPLFFFISLFIYVPVFITFIIFKYLKSKNKFLITFKNILSFFFLSLSVLILIYIFYKILINNNFIEEWLIYSFKNILNQLFVK